MNILFIVPYVPNLIRVRPYNLIRHLAQRGHQVTVMTLWTNQAERRSIEDLRAHCAAVEALPLQKWRAAANAALSIPGSQPMQANYCWQPALAQRIEAVLWPQALNGRPAFDVVHIEHLRGARYGLHIQSRFGKPGLHGKPNLPVPIVWDSVDSITHLFRQSSTASKKITSRFITRFELGRTEKHEARLAAAFDCVLVTSSNDRGAFLRLPELRQPAPPIQVLSNGVDLDYFTPDENIHREAKTLVISGKMSYHANVSMTLFFVEKVLPKIRERHPDVHLVIVGKDPPREIQALSQDANIEVTGTVDDIRPYLRKASAAVAPLTYGTGIQNKILEALACGTPVVTNQQAVSALEIKPDQEILTAANEEEFAQKVCRLLEDENMRGCLSRAGRQYVERQHRWQDIAKQLEAIYCQVIAGSGEVIG